jgi:hypothetical protein
VLLAARPAHPLSAADNPSEAGKRKTQAARRNGQLCFFTLSPDVTFVSGNSFFKAVGLHLRKLIHPASQAA